VQPHPAPARRAFLVPRPFSCSHSIPPLAPHRARRRLTSEGLAVRKHHGPISAEHLQSIHDALDGEDSYTVSCRQLFACGLALGCRGCGEHQNLSVKQFKFVNADHVPLAGGTVLQYTKDHCYKNYQGGSNEGPPPEPCFINRNELQPNFCLVRAVQRHLDDLQGAEPGSWYRTRRFIAKNKQGQLPAKADLTNSRLVGGVTYVPGFSKGNLGKNKISTIMREVLALAGLPDDLYTNHSLRATFITAGLKAGIPIQELMKRTGHKTEKGIMNYKRNDISDDTAMNTAIMSHNAGRPAQLEPVREVLAAAAAAARDAAAAPELLAASAPLADPQVSSVLPLGCELLSCARVPCQYRSPCILLVPDAAYCFQLRLKLIPATPH
jgi:hypothetical protein